MLKRIKSYPKTVLVWIAFSIGIIVFHLSLPEARAYELTTVTMSIIAAIYIGFALADGRITILIQEITAAVFFILLALLGLWLNPYFWVAAYFLHGVWDWLHHENGIRTKVPDYYPPVCVVVDWILAVFLCVWLLI